MPINNILINLNNYYNCHPFYIFYINNKIKYNFNNKLINIKYSNILINKNNEKNNNRINSNKILLFFRNTVTCTFPVESTQSQSVFRLLMKPGFK